MNTGLEVYGWNISHELQLMELGNGYIGVQYTIPSNLDMFEISIIKNTDLYITVSLSTRPQLLMSHLLGKPSSSEPPQKHSLTLALMQQ